MEMIVSGRHVPAEEAKKLGIIDEIVDEKDLRGAAIRFAKSVAAKRPLPRVRDKTDRLAEAKADPGMFEAMRKSIARKARNQKAPYHCIACVEAATTQPFEEGLQTERRLFAELENSDEAKALRYAFFAEREVAKIPGAPKDLKPPQREDRGGRRRRHDGRRHRDVLRRSRHPGEGARSHARGARQGHAARARQLRGERQARQHHAGARWTSGCRSSSRCERYEDIARLRRRHRGGVRAHRREEGRVREARRGDEAGRDAAHQFVGDRHRHHGERHEAAAGRRRRALLRARQRDEAVRSGAGARRPRSRRSPAR